MHPLTRERLVYAAFTAALTFAAIMVIVLLIAKGGGA